MYDRAQHIVLDKVNSISKEIARNPQAMFGISGLTKLVAEYAFENIFSVDNVSVEQQMNSFVCGYAGYARLGTFAITGEMADCDLGNIYNPSV